MRLNFATHVIKSLLAKENLQHDTSILAVCSGLAEHSLFKECQMKNVTLSGLDPSVTTETIKPYIARQADVRNLPFESASFDYVFVSDGLHHCDSPHRALLEMYRVARIGVIVIESRDNLLIRTAVNIGLINQYELSAVIGNGGTCGGVNYTSVPNFVYRWTEREFEKTILCADPTGKADFKYFYGFNAPNRKYKGIKALAYKICVLTGKFAVKIFRGQSNSFCMVAIKPKSLFPWLEKRNGSVSFRK